MRSHSKGPFFRFLALASPSPRRRVQETAHSQHNASVGAGWAGPSTPASASIAAIASLLPGAKKRSPWSRIQPCPQMGPNRVARGRLRACRPLTQRATPAARRLAREPGLPVSDGHYPVRLKDALVGAEEVLDPFSRLKERPAETTGSLLRSEVRHPRDAHRRDDDPTRVSPHRSAILVASCTLLGNGPRRWAGHDDRDRPSGCACSIRGETTLGGGVRVGAGRHRRGGAPERWWPGCERRSAPGAAVGDARQRRRGSTGATASAAGATSMSPTPPASWWLRHPG